MYCLVCSFLVNPPQVVITTSRDTPLYEGTTGLSLTCVVTPDTTGVDTDTFLTRGIIGPADSDRVTTSDTLNNRVATVVYNIGVLSLTDTGSYTCSAIVSPVSSQYVVGANNTASLDLAIVGE